MRIVGALLFSLIVASAAMLDTPDEAMPRFCQWEFDGGRLAPDAARREAEMVLQPPVTHFPSQRERHRSRPELRREA
jgi:hypothetical protein